jgi:hypothetical protein
MSYESIRESCFSEVRDWSTHPPLQKKKKEVGEKSVDFALIFLKVLVGNENC